MGEATSFPSRFDVASQPRKPAAPAPRTPRGWRRFTALGLAFATAISLAWLYRGDHAGVWFYLRHDDLQELAEAVMAAGQVKSLYLPRPGQRFLTMNDVRLTTDPSRLREGSPDQPIVLLGTFARTSGVSIRTIRDLERRLTNLGLEGLSCEDAEPCREVDCPLQRVTQMGFLRWRANWPSFPGVTYIYSVDGHDVAGDFDVYWQPDVESVERMDGRWFLVKRKPWSR
jgi:hypothetical protein